MATPTLDLLVPPTPQAQRRAHPEFEADVEAIANEFARISFGLFVCYLLASVVHFALVHGMETQTIPRVPLAYVWLTNAALFVAVSVTAIARLRGVLTSLNAVAARGRALEAAQATLRELATTDPLTGLSNRRTLLKLLDDEVDRSARYNRSLSVLILDLDHFKSINDTWGHAAGDEVLERIGVVLRACVRQQDIVGRTGGEEFLVVLPETAGTEAEFLANRLRAAIAQIRFDFDDSRKVTASIGVASRELGDLSSDLVARADEAMYVAKRAGRDCVIR